MVLRGVGVGFEWINWCNGMKKQLALVTSPKGLQGHQIDCRVRDGRMDNTNFIQYACILYMGLLKGHLTYVQTIHYGLLVSHWFISALHFSVLKCQFQG